MDVESDDSDCWETFFGKLQLFFLYLIWGFVANTVVGFIIMQGRKNKKSSLIRINLLWY